MTTDLNLIQTFLMVVKTGSFTAAAQAMGVTKSKISRQVQMLEQELETRLLQRSTRKISITERGQELYRSCGHHLDRFMEARDQWVQGGREPAGTLRITTATAFGAVSLPQPCARFMLLYPQVNLDLHLSDTNEDLIGGGFDCALRMGRPSDGTYKARRLFTVERGLYVAPSLISSSQGPLSLEQAAGLPHLLLAAYRGRKWPLSGLEGDRLLGFERVVLTANSTLFLLNACMEGRGSAILTTNLTAEPTSQGKLVKLLPDYHFEPVPFYVLYPAGPVISPTLRLFLDFLVDWFATRGSGSEPES